MASHLNRRSFLAGTGAAVAAGAAATINPAACADHHLPAEAAVNIKKSYQNGRSPWPVCMDTATIRPASLEDKINFAAAAGFDAIEPWEGELHRYEQDGGNLKDLGKKIKDKGLFVPSVIGLWNAIPRTRRQFDDSLVDSRRRMRQASDVGAEHIQVIPQPARPWQEFDPKWAAERYREILEIGLNDYNINPALVFVEFLAGVKRMGQAAAIAIDADHPKAKIIPDVFHMFIGDSGFNGLKHIQGSFIAIFQFNDSPAKPAEDKLTDADRVYPGDGVLPLSDILQDLHAGGYTGCISLELYNPEYYKQDLAQVARTGLEKTVKVIDEALA